MVEKQQRYIFPFRKRYAWNAQVTVDMPKQLGSERRIFHIKGEKTFEFRAIPQDPSRATLKLVDQRLTLPETDLVLSREGWPWAKPTRIPELTIGPDAIDLESSEGFVDLDTGAFTLQYTIRLTPKIVPLLEQYQVGEIPVLVQEAGQLDLGEGDQFDSWLRFTVAPEYTGELRFYCSGQKGCRTTTVICATLDGSPCQSAATVYVCPGEDVHLWWQSSEDVRRATISPGVGSVSPSGHTVVRPTSTTDYTIEVQGECKRSANVRVHVVQEGDIIDIVALPTRQAECWLYEMPKTICSKNIKITSISPQCGLGCFIHKPPLLNYPYLKCGSGAMCNGLWSVFKEDPDGHIHTTTTGSVYTGPLRVDLNDWPFAGTWRFLPLAPPYQYQGNGLFRLTAKCGR